MKLKYLIGLGFALCSTASFAETKVYDYVDVGYTSSDNDVLRGDYTGFELSGVIKLNDDFFLSGDYISTNEDRDLDFTRQSIDLGIILYTSENGTLYTKAGFAKVDFDRDDAASFEQTGYQISFGYQSELVENFTYSVELKHLNAREVDSTFGKFDPTYITLGGIYRLNDSISLYGDYEYEDEGERATFGVRYNF